MNNKINVNPVNSQFNCQLTIEKNELLFQYLLKDAIQKEIKLPAGYEFISSKFFLHPIPTDAETDYAINYIEDELMSNRELLQHNEKLYSADERLMTIFFKNELPNDSLSRQTVEDLFNRYARVIMGAPLSSIKVEITAEDFAILLLLREIMHHLNFDSINFQL